MCALNLEKVLAVYLISVRRLVMYSSENHASKVFSLPEQKNYASQKVVVHKTVQALNVASTRKRRLSWLNLRDQLSTTPLVAHGPPPQKAGGGR